MPALRTTPSRPPSSATDRSTSAAQSAGSARSATTTAAVDGPGLAGEARGLLRRRLVDVDSASAAPCSAARTAIARPLPGGASGSGLGRVPAPTTATRRPASALTSPSTPAGQPGRAGLELHAGAVQQAADEPVEAGEDEQLEELRRRPGGGEAGPGRVADDGRRRRARRPSAAAARRPRPAAEVRLGDAGDLGRRQPGHGAEQRVLPELVRRAAAPADAEDDELPLPGGQLAAVEQHVAEAA
jgi:hypothetical protein